MTDGWKIEVKSSPLPKKFGFLNEPYTVHTSRTLMLQELAELFRSSQPDTSIDEYSRLITESNVLAKPTLSSRKKTAKYISQLYSLDKNMAIFRVLRFFWERDSEGHSLMAALCAHARDSLLRTASDTVLSLPFGYELNLENLKETLEEKYPGRFSLKTLHSTVQNIASSYQQSGHLEGRRNKIRKRAKITPVAMTYALFLGYLNGYRGENLLSSIWSRLLDVPANQILELAHQAHKLGLMNFKKAGSVIDFGFDNLLTGIERKMLSD